MQKLFIKILAFILLFSFLSETVESVFENSISVYSALTENEDSEKKSESSKTEKEDEKDKVSISHLNNNNVVFSMGNYCRNNTVITTAYLSLPEIPPDQA
jgi:hypothetical protein